MEPKFFKCNHCGNMVDKIKDSGVEVVCCGDPMVEVKANTTDGAVEKHVPVYSVEGCKVKVEVGSVPHPMTEEHHIAWIELVTDQGIQRKELEVPNPAVAEFALLDNEKFVAVYEYCNLHGLWKAEA